MKSAFTPLSAMKMAVVSLVCSHRPDVTGFPHPSGGLPFPSTGSASQRMPSTVASFTPQCVDRVTRTWPGEGGTGDGTSMRGTAVPAGPAAVGDEAG